MADIQDDTSSTLENEVSAPTTTDDSNDTLLTLSFNQDGGCLAVGTAHGFRICNVSPYQETFRRSFDSRDGGGGIGSVAMLFRCNLLALVGGGTSPQYPTNKVLIWDDHIGRPIGELSFRQRVLAVRLSFEIFSLRSSVPSPMAAKTASMPECVSNTMSSSPQNPRLPVPVLPGRP